MADDLGRAGLKLRGLWRFALTATIAAAGLGWLVANEVVPAPYKHILPLTIKAVAAEWLHGGGFVMVNGYPSSDVLESGLIFLLGHWWYWTAAAGAAGGVLAGLVLELAIASAAAGQQQGTGGALEWRGASRGLAAAIVSFLGVLIAAVLLAHAAGLGWLAASGVAWTAGLLASWLTLRAMTSPTAMQGGAKRDIQEDWKVLQTYSRPFDPVRFIDLRKGIWIGLDERRRPVYIPHSALLKNHIQLIGESGTGKSSTAGVIQSQALQAGESVIIFDPKDDEFLAGVLAQAASQAGRRAHLLDLRPSAPPQLNPLVGCSETEVEELLNAALELGKTGNPGVDFYRAGDREAALSAARLDPSSIPDLLRKAGGIAEITERQNFWRELRQLASIPAICARNGLDLAKAIADGDLIYIIGSTTNDRVFLAQRLLLQRVLQIITSRPREGARAVSLMLDELKYLLSAPALRALGTVRDRNCHLVLAHQSLGDLDDCGSLSPVAVRGAVQGNTGLKFVYRVQHAETCAEFEALAGKERSWAENISKTRKNAIAPSEGAWREDQRERISAAMLANLPKPTAGEASVGVVYGLGPAFILSTRFMPAGQPPKVVPAEPDGSSFDQDLI